MHQHHKLAGLFVKPRMPLIFNDLALTIDYPASPPISGCLNPENEAK